MRRRLILGGLTLAVIVAGVIALAAFTAQVVNLTAHVEKDIAVEPVICANPTNPDSPCFVDPRGGDYGVVLPQEFYVKIIEVTLSNSFFEQSKFNDLIFDVLWECKQFSDKRDLVDNLTGEPVPGGDGWPDCREQGLDDSICAVDLDGDTIADTIRHCDPEKLDGNLRDHVMITPLLDGRCYLDQDPQAKMPAEKKVDYVASGALDKVNPKCRYEVKLFAPPCINGFNPYTDPHPLAAEKKPVACHVGDKDRDENPGLVNPQDIDEFADLGDDFKIQVTGHSLAANRVLLYQGHGGWQPEDEPGSTTDYFDLDGFYDSLGYISDYENPASEDNDLSDGAAGPNPLSDYKTIVMLCPKTPNFSAAEVANLANYMRGGGRLAVLANHSGFCPAINPLLTALPGIAITENGDAATPDGDTCAPLTDISADQVTAGVASLDPAATASLTLGAGAKSLARVNVAPHNCANPDNPTWLAVDQVSGAPSRPGGDLVVSGDSNVLDDYYGFGDPAGDGNADNVRLGFNLVDY